MTSREETGKWTPVHGILLTLGLHAVALAVVAIISSTRQQSGDLGDLSLVVFGGLLGATQLVYMIPAMIWAAVAKKNAILKGLILGASLTLLGNALCFGLFTAFA